MQQTPWKLWLNPWRFFRQKRPVTSPNTGLHWDDRPSLHHHQYSGVFGGQRRLDDPHLPYLPTRPQWLFSLPEKEVGAGWQLAARQQLQDKLGGGPPNPHQTWVSSCYSAVDRTLWKAHLNRRWPCKKKNRNNWFLKMICIQDILPCTSYVVVPMTDPFPIYYFFHTSS